MKKKKTKVVIIGLGNVGYLYSHKINNIISTHTQAVLTFKKKLDFFAAIEKNKKIRNNFEKKLKFQP